MFQLSYQNHGKFKQQVISWRDKMNQELIAHFLKLVVKWILKDLAQFQNIK